MKFRPCIDVHRGLVKQIVGSTLSATGDLAAEENFVSGNPPSFFADMYKRDGLRGGHVIMLGGGGEAECMAALRAYPGGLQIGGGVDLDNALRFLDAGASHVIVTSFVFHDGAIDFDRLDQMGRLCYIYVYAAMSDTCIVRLVGRERLVLDLSCRRKEDGGEYFVVTNKWTQFTSFALTEASMARLSGLCAEFLVHGVDVEGRRCGIEEPLVRLLAHSPIPVCYAGGVRDLADLERVKALGQGRVDCTIGSALDVFGGALAYAEVVEWSNAQSAHGSSA